MRAFAGRRIDLAPVDDRLRGVGMRRGDRRLFGPGQGAASSEFLACGPEQDFVDVHVLRLAYGEHQRTREGVRGNRVLVGLADARRDIIRNGED